MRTRQDTDSTVSVHDQFSDAHVSGFGFADEQPDDAFAADQPLSAEDEAEMHAAFLRRPGTPPVGYFECPCPGCGAALYVPEGEPGGVLCQPCQREAVAV